MQKVGRAQWTIYLCFDGACVRGLSSRRLTHKTDGVESAECPIPTDPFTIFEPKNPSINVCELHKVSWSADVETVGRETIPLILSTPYRGANIMTRKKMGHLLSQVRRELEKKKKIYRKQQGKEEYKQSMSM